MGEGDNVECVGSFHVVHAADADSCGCRLFIGESFVEASEEYAQEYIERVVEVRSR